MQNVPIRTPLGREIRGCFEAEDGQRADLRRLLADRAARARARRRRARAEGDLRARRGRAHGDRLAGVRGRGRRHRPGHALEGEDDQLRDRLRAVGLRPRRPPEHPARGGQGVHRRLPGALPARGARSSPRRSSRPSRRATSRRCGAGAARSPSCRRATTRCARSASAWPSTPSSRAPPPTSSSWRWCARTPRSPQSALQHAPAADDPRRAAVRRPAAARQDAARELIEREMCGVWEHEPPLAVDVGVGQNWLEAK